MSLLVLAAVGMGGRRAYDSYKNKVNIKKEINKRFRFNGDSENGPANDYSERFNQNSGNGEESKRNSHNSNDGGSDKKAGVLSKGFKMAGSLAGSLASKVNFKKTSKKTEDEDNDPSKYHQLDDGADHQQNSRKDTTTRQWSQDGVKIVDTKGNTTMSSEPSQRSADLIGSGEVTKVKGSVVADDELPDELQDIDLNE